MYKNSRTTVVRSSIFDNSLYTVDQKKNLVKWNESISLNFYFYSTFNKKKLQKMKNIWKNSTNWSSHFIMTSFLAWTFLDFLAYFVYAIIREIFHRKLKKYFFYRKKNKQYVKEVLCLLTLCFLWCDELLGWFTPPFSLWPFAGWPFSLANSLVATGILKL